jgi:hypothetical protein
MKRRFYLSHPNLGTLYTDDGGIADYAVKHAGWSRVSSREYGKLRASPCRHRGKIVRHGKDAK